jgi:hypothetical protein
MCVKKNVCESLLGTLLNTDRKCRGHGHAQDDLKKMGIRSELWLDDSVKRNETTHIMQQFCGFLKNVELPSGYLKNISSLI